MTPLLVNIAGLCLMVGVIWWFWLAGGRKLVIAQDGRIDVRVAHGAYSPDRIAVPVGQTVQFRFIREDPSPCAGVVRFEGLSISRDLPVDNPVTLAIRYDEPGEYAFTCQMGMYRGQIIVK